MKGLLKRIIPTNILGGFQRFRIISQFNKYAAYDKNLFLTHSNIIYQNTQSKCLGKIILNYHVIEKGLTMPDMKSGFGKERLMLLVNECLNYKKNYDNKNAQFLHALSVIAEYYRVHRDKNYKFDEELLEKIEFLLNQEGNIPYGDQIKMTCTKYFEFINAPFDKFSESRHSVRSFLGSVELASINKAVELAQNSPSACNRQPSRVHIITDEVLIKRIFKIQNGNRGFGHLVDKLIILTTDLSVYQSAEERNCAFIDGGIYAMNLLYALHFHRIGVCALNWCSSPSNDIELREIVPLPGSEIVILLIACGSVPGEFKLTASKRNNYNEIIKIH